MNVTKYSKGFSLVELITVMAIMGILLSIVSLNFSSWQRKSQIERETRDLYVDINAARTESIFRKTRHRFTFQPNNYVYKRYSSENEPYTAGTEVLSRNVTYQITRENGGDISDYSIEFDARGLVTGQNFSSPNLTLRVNPIGNNAAIDCLIIHVARTNLGKMNNDGTACEPN